MKVTFLNYKGASVTIGGTCDIGEFPTVRLFGDLNGAYYLACGRRVYLKDGHWQVSLTREERELDLQLTYSLESVFYQTTRTRALLLFAHQQCYPEGGVHDFVTYGPTEEYLEAVFRVFARRGWQGDSWECGYIADGRTLRVVRYRKYDR